ncbi:MAG: mycofactocin radical SAM maturase [Clostridia bacterium]|nr:mycofactocin radical SAM maturase [Clostridia bacterium]
MNWNIENTRLWAPICLTWQLTGRCNLRCIHCLADSRDESLNELEMDEIRDFLDDLADMKVFYINVGGGEPLLHTYFFEIMDYAAAKGIYVQFSTNGTLIDSVVATGVAKRGLRVQVSLDGWQPAINDPVRGVGTFHKAVNAIRLLRERNVEVAVNCVVTGSTVAGLNEMLELATSYGAGLRLSRLRPSGRAQDKWQELAPSREQYLKLYHWLKKHPEVKTGDSFFFLSSLGAPLPGLSYCGAGRLTCSVDPQGFVFPCPFTIHSTMVAGNIREKPLSELWQEAKLFTRLRTAKPEACTACPTYQNCRGGCRGASFLAYGNWNRADPECVRGENNGKVSV